MLKSIFKYLAIIFIGAFFIFNDYIFPMKKILFIKPIYLQILMLAGIMFFILGIYTYFQNRLIRNTPTSTVRGLAMGLVEIYGKVEPHKHTLKSPFTNKDCVYYMCQVEEIDGSYFWIDAKFERFYLHDKTGKVLINPFKANFDIKESFQTDSGSDLSESARTFLIKQGVKPKGMFGNKKKLRFTEHYLALNENVYVLGTATSSYNSKNDIKNEDKIEIRSGQINKTFLISNLSKKEILETNKWVPLQIFGSLILFLVIFWLRYIY